MLRIYLLFAFFLLTTVISGQEYSADAIREDLIALKAGILEYNPFVTQYNPVFQDQADSLISSVKAPLELYGAYGKMSQLCALAAEGHFELGQWSDLVHSPIREDLAPFAPFSVYVKGQQLFIQGDYSKEGVMLPGDEIKSINGVPASDLIETLLNYIPSDGDIRTYAIRRLEENFPWFYYFYIEQAKRFDMALFRPSTGETLDANLVPLLRKERIEIASTRYPKSTEPKMSAADRVYELDIRDTYAILTLKSFDYRLVEALDIKAKDLYEEIFKKLKEREVAHLIVDLRGNTGGRNEFGEDIAPFIMKPGLTKPAFLMRSVSWKGKNKTLKMPRRHPMAFDGNLVVLVDGKTYSTGAVISRFCKELGDATVMGEETGTRYDGFVAGSKRYVTLKNTGLRFGIPCYHKFFPESPKQILKNRGLIPDIIISADITDRIAKTDPILEAAIERCLSR